ncbi:Crp/Fnr family transcriptional regulator [Hydrogenophaga sp. IBVHS2]|uniref:Crp/Fnr family transcriptional regulator n=1 Tax=Hydrogenophaga sp. IBVHS2 TaxID=1985170 RepID=UPI000A2DDA00|nr:Crp/Fnr family transcriptional regulator [Hydrogenophaga sp. IBVHS2]OSZ65801.1 Crp/Fnr family transcriptional regulator [Hydrogenophaga sp. IBVHS2]
MPPTDNLLIRQLPRRVRQALLSRCQPFVLAPSAELGQPGQPLRHAYFLTEGFVALLIDMDAYPSLQVGMVGRDDMLGAELLLGLGKAPWRAVVQGPGLSWRIGAQALRRECALHPSLLRLVQARALLHLQQQTLTAACGRFHHLSERLARWLLVCQDAAHSSRFHITQECMALMLGVRRVGVTVAASEFQQGGLIRYHRGELTVLDRVALAARACSCYAADRQLRQALVAR